MFSKNNLLNLIVLFSTLLFIFVGDRILLTRLTPPLWIADEILHYKHRPNAVSFWSSYENKPILINSHGHHDDEFPIQKPIDELRILCLGDSVTMGHGVTREETYVNQLEGLFQTSNVGFETYQVINTGVQGYSTFQELEILRRSWKFEPDYVTIGFVMNDVTEPFIINRDFGGTGIDYHGVFQTSNQFTDYLLNNTGLGRLAVKLQYRLVGDPKKAKLAETYNLRRIIENKEYYTDKNIKSSWDLIMKDLEEVYSLANEREIGVSLIIFPYTFQLNNPDSQWPQKILKEQAKQHGANYIDFTEIFEQQMAKNKTDVDFYFLDADHFTVEGHKIVAESLFMHLSDNLNIEHRENVKN